jgi:hypothetical protein
MIIYEGITGGQRYAVIATGITTTSSNSKTGNMIQIWIVLADIDPVVGVQSGLDAATVCRGCPFASGNGCYVNVGQAPLAIWRAYRTGKYKHISDTDWGIFAGRKVRFGAYGNPSLIPLAIVKRIADLSAGWTGYYHDWHNMPRSMAIAYGHYFMASTETSSSLAMAQALRLRTFHVSPVKPAGSLECLSETHNIKCADCLLCAGLSKPAKSIWINPHGAGKSKATKVATSN